MYRVLLKPIVKLDEVLDISIVQYLIFSFAQAILGHKDLVIKCDYKSAIGISACIDKGLCVL